MQAEMATSATMNERSRHQWHQEARTTRRILPRPVVRLTTEVKALATRRTTTLQRRNRKTTSLTYRKTTWATHRLRLPDHLPLRTWGRKVLDPLLGLLLVLAPISLPIM